MIKAKLVRDIQNRPAEQKLWRLSESVPYGWSEDMQRCNFVVTSHLARAFDTGRPETYIFPADKDGSILSWGEMDGSSRGGDQSHEDVLRNAGWEVEE